MKFRNDVEAPPAGDGLTHIHNYSPSEAAPILAKGVVAVIVLFVGWHAGVFLFDQMGAIDPRRAFAQMLVWGIIIMAFIYVASRWLGGLIADFYNHRQTMADKATEQLRYRQMLQASMVSDTRRLGDDQRLAALVLAIMEEAYHQLARDKQNKFTGLSRPWSRRAAGRIILASLGEVEPVGAEFGSKVRQFLQDQRIIVHDQIDLRRFPDIGSVQRALFTPPTIMLRNSSYIKK